MKLIRKQTSTLIMLLLLFGLMSVMGWRMVSPGGTRVSAHAFLTSGFLYVLNDNASGNQIYGYAVDDATGVLTLLPGFPLSTGGTGTAGFVPSQQLTIDRLNLRLYVLNDGSDTLSAFSINSTTGALTPLPFSPLNLGRGVWYTMAVHPSGSPLVIGDSNTNPGRLLSYRITATTATPASGSPYNLGTTSPFSTAFSQNGNYVYTGGNFTQTMAGFSVDAATGVLTALPGSPFNSGGLNPLAYATDGLGRLLMANFVGGQVRVFTTTSGVPSAVSSNPFTSGLIAGAHGVLHPNGFYLVADRSGNRVGVYRVNGSGNATALSPVAGSPFAAGGAFTNILALNQAGTFLFAANGSSRNLTTFNVNSATGALTALGAQPANTLGTAGEISGLGYLSTSSSPCQTITLSPGTLPGGTIGTAYNQTITASPAGSYTFTFAGSLPTGLSLSSSGVLSGTPTTAGTSSFSIAAIGSGGCTGSQTYSLTISNPACPSVTGVTPASGAIGSNVTINGTGFTGVSSVKFFNNVTATFTVVNDTTITATVPSGAASGPIKISKTGCNDVQTSTFTIIVCPTITVNPTSLPNGTVGIAYSQTLTASGGTAPHSFAVTAGTLPNGLTLTTGGLLSGTPSTAGSFSFTITATATGGCTGTRSYTVNIANGTTTPGFLYALNDCTACDNQLYGFAVNEATGALTLLAGFPISTGGNGGIFTSIPHSERLAIDRTNRRLYALNSSFNTVSAYAINSATGALTPLPFSPINLGGSLGFWTTITVHPSGSPLIIQDTNDTNVSRLHSYRITATTATAAAGSPYSLGSASHYSSVFSQDGNFLYAGFVPTTIAGFSVNAATGVLTALPGSPFSSGNNYPSAYATDTAGRLFIANALAGQVRVFTTTSGVPSAVSGNPFTSGLTGAVQGLIHPNGFYLVADGLGNRVGVYRVNGSGSSTTLTAVAGSPFAAGGTFTDVLALNQAGTFLFAANGDTRNVTTFSVNGATGALTLLSTQPANTLGTAGFISGLVYIKP